MKHISTKEVERMINDGKSLHIIDVREVEEVKEGKIAGAMHIPLGLLEFRMHELDNKKEYMVICRSGGRSSRAAQLLESAGFSVINISGGMMAWEGSVQK